MILSHTDILFDKDNHTYTNSDGVVLTSVTTMLRRQLFADMYDGIPKQVLDAAAKHGDAIHEEIEIYDGMGIEPASQQAIDYKKLKGEHKAIVNEYLVANSTHAGQIDCVWESEGDLILTDIKTTSKLHTDYVTWQLSVYAYLFELCNPDKKIAKLYCAWLPKPQYGKATLQPLERIPSETIEALLKADAAGEQFVLPTEYAPAVTEEPLPTEYAEAEAKLVAALQYIEEQKKAMEESEKVVAQLKEQLLTAMEANGIKKWQTDRLTITYKAAYTSPKVDTAKLKKDGLYDQYTKESQVKSSIQIKLC